MEWNELWLWTKMFIIHISHSFQMFIWQQLKIQCHKIWTCPISWFIWDYRHWIWGTLYFLSTHLKCFFTLTFSETASQDNALTLVRGPVQLLALAHFPHCNKSRPRRTDRAIGKFLFHAPIEQVFYFRVSHDLQRCWRQGGGGASSVATPNFSLHNFLFAHPLPSHEI